MKHVNETVENKIDMVLEEWCRLIDRGYVTPTSASMIVYNNMVKEGLYTPININTN